MKTQTEKILNVLRIIAWIGYVGWLIIFGILIIMAFFGFLTSNFEFTKYPKISIQGSEITLKIFREKYPIQFIAFVGIVILETFLVVKIWEVAKNTLTEINLKHPFSYSTAAMIEKISYLIFSIWLLELFGTAYGRYIQTLFTDITVKFTLSTEFSYLFMAGIIYLISQIFKRGVELQEENELTV
jgi:hypothetical protein